MIPMMAPFRAIVSVFLGKKDKIFTILKRGNVFDVIVSFCDVTLCSESSRFLKNIYSPKKHEQSDNPPMTKYLVTVRRKKSLLKRKKPPIEPGSGRGSHLV